MESKEEYNIERIEKSEYIDDEYLSYPYVLTSKESNGEQVKDIEKKFFSMLKDMNEDTKKLGELLIEEKTLVKDICNYLINIFSHLNLAVVLPNMPIPRFNSYKEIILNSQGHLIIVKEDETVESRSLLKYPPETILMVVWAVIPKLKDIVNTYTRQVSIRLDLFERINEELKNVQDSFEDYRGEHEENSEDSLRENAKGALIQRK